MFGSKWVVLSKNEQPVELHLFVYIKTSMRDWLRPFKCLQGMANNKVISINFNDKIRLNNDMHVLN